MKAPVELSARLASQWRRPALRLARLTSSTAWPLRLPIGRPPPSRIERDPEIVRAHVQAWSSVNVGEVEWEYVRYRSTGQSVRVPLYWKLSRPALWVEACADRAVMGEYASISRLCAATPENFHPLWIGKTHLWQGKPETALLRAAQVAMILNPGYAGGKPLRALPLTGADTKFYENHRTLLLAMLDVRFDGAPSKIGLEAFLGADPEDGHWILMADLSRELLPFARQRVNTQELATIPKLPGTHLLVVENERCMHQLPIPLEGVIAVLGAGLDLGWLTNSAVDGKELAYWGDLDTWGLRMLGLARLARANITPLMMDSATFHSHALKRAVTEPEVAEPPPDGGLTDAELRLFELLKGTELGRLEQEFLPAEETKEIIRQWRNPK